MAWHGSARHGGVALLLAPRLASLSGLRTLSAVLAGAAAPPEPPQLGPGSPAPGAASAGPAPRRLRAAWGFSSRLFAQAALNFSFRAVNYIGGASLAFRAGEWKCELGTWVTQSLVIRHR